VEPGNLKRTVGRKWDRRGILVRKWGKIYFRLEGDEE
jgi:hypothetical protein